MAGLLHVVVGVVAARWEHRRARPLLSSFFASGVLFAGLSLAPDLDVFGLALGVPYEAPWGHRGATHSLSFAALVALFVAALALLCARPFWRTLGLTFVVVASHGLLDALTDGGLGIALLWPITTRRYFAPFTPIPVAPLGRGVFSWRALRVATTEALLVVPLLLLTWRRERTK